MAAPPGTDALLPKPGSERWGEDVLPFLLGVSALAALVIAYLVFDWIRSRRAAQRLEQMRRAARDEWQQRLLEEKTKRDSESPEPDAEP